jgi:integrase/recombinase XerD
MKQARTLTQQEIKVLLATIASGPHALRNRTMMLLTHWAGLRVGEVAALRIKDVVDADGKVLTEIRLLPEQTKNKHARTVFVNQRLRKELQTYVNAMLGRDIEKPLFYTQKRSGFSANTATQLFISLYRKAGLVGATSHSGRRSFITSLAAKGVSVRLLASLAGHRSITTTQAYIDVNDEMKRHAVELVV